MPKHVLQIFDAVVKFADDASGLTTAPDYSCQVISAALTPSPVTGTAPATMCEGETDIVGRTKWNLDLAWLQDWDQPEGGLSNYLFLHETEVKAFSILLDRDATEPAATGECRIVAGAYGGTAGIDPLQADSSMPLTGKPAIAVPAALP